MNESKSDQTKKQGFGISVSTPPGSIKSKIHNPDTTSALTKYIKGYTLVILGSLIILLTFLGQYFGLGKGTIFMHFLLNFGVYMVAMTMFFFVSELGLKIFKHN
jgi:hypothetical protein